jgi:hypothetical protein
MAKFDSKTFNPQAFAAYSERIPQLKKNELVRSGALKGNSEIRGAFSAQTGTGYAIVPMYGLLGGDVLNYDGTTDIKATTTNTYERGVVVVGRAQAWLESDFAEDITGGAGFMDNVAAQVSEYFDGVDQNTLLSILEGVFNMTGEENLKFVENHTYDITADGDGVIEPASLNKAVQKACGDNKNRFTLAIMHSAVATNLENLNLLEYLKYTDGNGISRDLTLATWNGRAVLIDDSMPVTEVEGDSEGGTATQYTTYILGAGAFDYEDIGAENAYEMYRNPIAGGGQDVLFVRQRKCFAPCGISYTKKKQATLSPTDEELKDGANWELVNDGGEVKSYIDHKSIPIARIISRG